MLVIGNSLIPRPHQERYHRYVQVRRSYFRVEASDEARKDLSGWLTKDTTRLVFIYFDLVVGNLTYHPGSCPNDGKTAIDAQTPLAWVLTIGGPSGGRDIGTHSFAHAYLTLPVSYPRIYSMGILESHYVPRMRHEVYGMSVVVDNATAAVDGESCWNELNKTEKASLMLEVVQDLVRALDRSDNTTSWSMCYTDPTKRRSSLFKQSTDSTHAILRLPRWQGIHANTGA